mgnify:CR=1 FL=1
METNEHNTKEELIKENVVTDETPQEEVTEETTTELTNEEKLQQEVERLNDQVYRLSAEISNIQKRNAKERQDAAKYRSQSLAQNLLNVIDNHDKNHEEYQKRANAFLETLLPSNPINIAIYEREIQRLFEE